MQIEMHELDLRYADLRIADPGRRARLAESLLREGQQSPVLVVAEGEGQYVLVDGYQRVAALRDLGRDTVEGAVLPVREVEALVLKHRLETARRRSALEDGWLVQELVERHQMSQQEVGSQLRKTKSWVSRRLGLVRVLPEGVQRSVRVGLVPAQAAMKSLVPLARANALQCARLVANLGKTAVSVRQVGRLYGAWRLGDEEQRARIVENPHLFLKVEEALEPGAPAEDEAGQLLADFEAVAGLCGRARRRVEKGVLGQVQRVAGRQVARSWGQARLAFESLAERVDAEVPRA